MGEKKCLGGRLSLRLDQTLTCKSEAKEQMEKKVEAGTNKVEIESRA